MFFFAILYVLLKIITLFKINKFILFLNSLSNFRRRLLFYIEFIKIILISKNKTISKNVLIFIKSFSISLAVIFKCLINDYLNYKVSAIKYANSFSISLAVISKYLINNYLNYKVFAIESIID